MNVPVSNAIKFPPAQPVAPQQVIEQPPPSDEPSAKRLKTAEELLIPEQDYLAQYGGMGPVLFNISVPNVPEKPEWNLNGQVISLTMPLTETVGFLVHLFEFSLLSKSRS